MPLQATSGVASYDAFGGGVAAVPQYIEDVFSTWLRTGTGSSVTVPTGLNGAINETMVWTKSRSAATNHKLTDTARGVTKALSSNTTGAEVTDSQGLTAFSSTGYTIGTNTDYNNSGATYVDWQWVATPKFFDVVTYTGTGSAQNIAHNLGSVPGCIIVKRTDDVLNWIVYHRTQGASKYGLLNTTNAFLSVGDSIWNSTEPTSSNFSVGTSLSASGGTYVAYLFAHNAGGFGLSGTDNVISCGSFTTDVNGVANVNLGWEAQFAVIKRADSTGNWGVLDVMRGWSNGGVDANIWANLSSAEILTTDYGAPGATGFVTAGLASNSTYIYIAIRRGPMRTPTTGTSVFAPVTYTGNGTTQTVNGPGFPLDLTWIKGRSPDPENPRIYDRLRGATKAIDSTSTAAETTRTDGLTVFTQSGFTVGSFGNENGSGSNIVSWNFGRAPGFFDEVCYTGNSDSRNLRHNLGVVPELAIVKCRDTATNWAVIYPSYIYDGRLNSSEAFIRTYRPDLTTRPWTTTTFSVGSNSDVNSIGQTYVAYLFATCPGVSKVGSYTGTGTTQTINCGFTAGSRFVMIKRTDSTGDWYVWDSARGIVAGNDPYLLLNSTAAEVTNTDFIDTAATGFEISSTAPAAINASGGTYIFLAIA